MDKVPWDKLIDAGVIGLTVTVILALVGWISSVLKEWMDRRRKARYLAVRIVPIIDQFLNDCSACLGDDGLLFGNADENGYTPPREKLPSTPDYPDDIDWLSIDHKIMYGLLLLPHQVKSATESILWMDLNVSTPPDFDEGFEARRGRFWHDLSDAITYSSPLHEEAITQYNSLTLTRSHRRENFIYQFNKKTEEPKTGADWLWVFFDPGTLHYILVAVQAKRLYSSGKYDALKITQTQKLIDYAQNQWLGCVPVYVFYNHSAVRINRPPVLHKNWNLALRPSVIDPVDLGCTFVNAHVVMHYGESISKNPQSLSANTRPWWHLVCKCQFSHPRFNPSDPMTNLAERLQLSEPEDDDSFIRPRTAEGPMLDFLTGESLPEEKLENMFGLNEIDPEDPDAFRPEFLKVTRINNKEAERR